MTDAPLQPAAAPLRTEEIYQTFIALCVDTEGTFESACATAAVRGFAAFDEELPVGAAARILAEARFRKPGYFFTATKYMAEAAGRPARRVQHCTLVARPASFSALTAALAADLRAPTSTTATPSVEYLFLGDPRDTPALASRADAAKGFDNGQGDLVTITAFEVREHPGVPGDAVGLTYQRWTA